MGCSVNTASDTLAMAGKGTLRLFDAHGNKRKFTNFVTVIGTCLDKRFGSFSKEVLTLSHSRPIFELAVNKEVTSVADIPIPYSPSSCKRLSIMD